MLESAKITGRSWRTDKGLRVGSAESQIKKLYRGATRTKVGKSVKWVLVPGQKPELSAWVSNGKVQSVRLQRALSS